MIPKILYAEDDQCLREGFSESISLYFRHRGIDGVEVITATNGQEAINIILEIREGLALVITDMRMPLKNGDKVAEEAINLGIPVIFLTGYSEDISGELKAKCHGVFEKPADIKDVLDPAIAAIR